MVIILFTTAKFLNGIRWTKKFGCPRTQAKKSKTFLLSNNLDKVSEFFLRIPKILQILFTKPLPYIFVFVE